MHLRTHTLARTYALAHLCKKSQCPFPVVGDGQCSTTPGSIWNDHTVDRSHCWGYPPTQRWSWHVQAPAVIQTRANHRYQLVTRMPVCLHGQNLCQVGGGREMTRGVEHFRHAWLVALERLVIERLAIVGRDIDPQDVVSHRLARQGKAQADTSNPCEQGNAHVKRCTPDRRRRR